jgi:signal transduction histidine kinase
MEEISKLKLVRSHSPVPDNGSLSRNKIANLSPSANDQEGGFMVGGLKSRPSKCPDIIDFGAEMGGIEKVLREFVGEDVRLEIDWSEDSVALSINSSEMLRILLMLLANSVEALHRLDAPSRKRRIAVRSLLSRGPYWLADHGEIGSAEYIEITVRDSGTGIGPDVLSHIFDHGFSTRPVASEEEPREPLATGIGLTMVKQLVEDAGGQIRIVSKSRFGTRVDLALPVKAEEFDRVPSANNRGLSRSGIRREALR